MHLFSLQPLSLALKAVGVLLVVQPAFANSYQSSPTGEEAQAIGKLDPEKVINTAVGQNEVNEASQSAQATALEAAGIAPRSVNMDETWTTDEVYAKLLEDPNAFEQLLLRSLAQTNAAALKTLLPAYDRYPAKDPSVIDWGNAILALAEGNTKEAVERYRKVNAALPDVRLLRIQMASALYQNRQVKAAKNELQKLLSADISEKERKEITDYIDAMNRQDKWNYNFNLSFVKNDNLEDSPEQGTTNRYGWAWQTPRESGTGARYSVGADKKWSFDNRMFASFSAGVGGTYYWDNKKYNEVNANTSVGIGYQTPTAEIEIAPMANKTWYGGGIGRPNGDGSLESYSSSLGVRLSGHKWVSPRFMVQSNTQFTDLSYKSPFEHNDGEIYSTNNGILYAPNPKTFYTAAWNLSKKDGVREDNSFERTGLTLGWQNTWAKGLVTHASVGVASKKYDGVNFWGITRQNKEFDVGLSIWKRDFSVFNLTPKLHLSGRRVTSNDKFEEKSSTDATISLSKTF